LYGFVFTGDSSAHDEGFRIRALTHVGSEDLEDTVYVNLKRDFDLRNTLWCRWDTAQLEFTEEVVILCRTFILGRLDQHHRLVISRSREDVALPRRDDIVPRDEFDEHATGRFDTESERVDVD
jgi:hypothetical protein